MSFKDWREVKLGELLNFRRGHDLPKTKMLDGNIPVVGSNGIIGFHNEFKTKAPCLTIGRSGNIGNPCYINKNCWAHNTSLYVDDFKGNDPKYLYYLLKTLNLSYYGGGSAVPTLNRNHIHPIEVMATINKNEQKFIAATLSSLDDKIELNNCINKNLEEIAQAIFKSWFVDFDPFQDGEFEDSELGRIPKGWRVKNFDDVCVSIFSGGTPSTQNPEFWNGSLNWLSSGETRNKYIVKTEKKITIAAVENSSTRMAKKYDVVIASAGQGNTRGQTSICLTDTYINQSLVCLRANNEIISPAYLFFNIERRYDELRKISDSSSIRGSLTTKMMKNLKLILPDQNSVNGFSEACEPLLSLIEKINNENESLICMRNTLLPKLMSGEIRVPIEEVN